MKLLTLAYTESRIMSSKCTFNNNEFLNWLVTFLAYYPAPQLSIPRYATLPTYVGISSHVSNLFILACSFFHFVGILFPLV